MGYSEYGCVVEVEIDCIEVSCADSWSPCEYSECSGCVCV